MMLTRGRRAFLGLLIILFLFSPQPLEAAPGAEGTIIHVVERGENLTLIAARYGTTVGAIVQANDIANPNLIYVGQRLVIPSAVEQPPELPTQAQVHVVRPGEYLSLIARLYSTTVWTLAVANDLANPSLIYPEQRLIIPPRSATLPAPIRAVEFVPPRVTQGHTLLLEVRAEEEVSLAGSIDGRSLTFTGAGGEYWALAGFPPWSEPGAHPWSIVATDDEGRVVEASGYVLVTATEFPIQYIDLPPDREGLLDPELVQAEWARVKALFVQVTPSKLWQGRFLVPVEGEVSSLFGTRRSYEGGPVASYHMGVDYAAPEGAPVVATNSGRIDGRGVDRAREDGDHRSRPGGPYWLLPPLGAGGGPRPGGGKRRITRVRGLHRASHGGSPPLGAADRGDRRGSQRVDGKGHTGIGD